ncbi:hypothetical protein NE857_21450 [Nocardiopsis exhalans]|uniref:Uncharacterized protein n=1 Tax=Nocardiopsis exhalans TaxID=163604 RepID=A0ABY5D2X7_9ACTN|nr:hypothetical protein [Nocardiopsis exhalans]USY17883.1 hypothetical protein NE857_21450 [Nocardiopsis exhalans]
MGADVLAWLGDVAVTVWGWARSTFTWTDLMPLAAILVSLWVLKQNKASREVAEDAKGAAEEANRIARGSNTLAEKANGIAERMETLAQEANDFARRALTAGEGANEIAVEANQIARGANDLAKEANDLFKKQDERAIERHDVRWEGEFVRPGVYRLMNKGEHTAYDVKATVSFEGEEVRREVAQVPGGESVEFAVPSAEEAYTKARKAIDKLRAERKEMEEAARERGGIGYAGPATFDRYQTRQTRIESIQMSASTHTVSEVVHWETERHSPREYESSGTFVGSLGGEL